MKINNKQCVLQIAKRKPREDLLSPESRDRLTFVILNKEGEKEREIIEDQIYGIMLVKPLIQSIIYLRTGEEL